MMNMPVAMLNGMRGVVDGTPARVVDGALKGGNIYSGVGMLAVVLDGRSAPGKPIPFENLLHLTMGDDPTAPSSSV
jgi:hypothetical protein